MSDKELKAAFESVCLEYLAAFCNQMKISIFDCYWIGDMVGTVAAAGDYIIDFNDIRYCVDNGVKWGVFARWYDYDVAAMEYNELIGGEGVKRPNLKSWCNGVPLDYTLEELQTKIEKCYAERDSSL